MSKKVILFVLAISLFGSCASLKKGNTHVTDKNNEVVVEQDAKPPVGYRPNFVIALDKFRTDTSINFQTSIIHTDLQKGKVRIYFNITDDRGRLYLHANHEKWKKAWCSLEEKSGDKNMPIRNYQLIHSTELDNNPVAFAFVLDHSTSMGDLRIFTVQNAVSNLVQNDKKPEDAIAVIKYDQQVLLEVPLTKDPDLFMEQFKFSGLQESGGMSAINDALDKAIDALDADSNSLHQAVVLFTDGTDNGSKAEKAQVIKKANSKAIKVFAIDFGANTDGGYMMDLAEQTGGCYYHIYRTSEFNYIFHDIYKRLKNAYVIEYLPSFFGNNEFRMLLCNNSKKIEMQKTFLNELITGKRIRINITFDPGKTMVKSIYKAELDRIAMLLKKESGYKFALESHTDDLGNDKTNLVLSQKRADAIRAELIKRGIDQSRLSAKGCGETSPIADNKTKEGKQLNRRTELVVVE